MKHVIPKVLVSDELVEKLRLLAKKRKIHPCKLVKHIWGLYERLDEKVIKEYIWSSNF